MSVISGIYAANKQSKSAEKAADSQVEAAKISADTMMKMFNKSRDDTANQRNMFDTMAFPAWQKMFSDGNLKPEINLDLENDKIYQATVDETMRALNRRAGATGKYSSSDADNAVLRNMSGLLTDAYGRKMTAENIGYNRLLDATKIGAGAAHAAGQNAIATGQGVASTQMQAGNAIAQGQLAQGQAQANAANSVGNTAQNIWLAYMLNKG